MARALDRPLVDRVYATGVCHVLFFTLYVVHTAVPPRPAASLPHLSVCFAVGLLCLVCPVLSDPGQRAAFLSGGGSDGAVNGPVAHGASADHLRCSRRRPMCRVSQ